MGSGLKELGSGLKDWCFVGIVRIIVVRVFCFGVFDDWLVDFSVLLVEVIY